VRSQLSIIPRTTRKNASAVPSLNILSHSKISASLRGAPTDLNIERTATGSVAEITPPNKRHTRKGICNPRRGNIKYNPKATKKAEIRRPITARLPIDLQLARSCL